MKCPSCNKIYKNNEKKCLNCGKNLVFEELDLELPLLKDEFIEEKTKAINTIDSDDNFLSLLDDINKQIDSVNQSVDSVNQDINFANQSINSIEQNIDSVNQNVDFSNDNKEKDDVLSVVQEEELFEDCDNVLSTDDSIKSRKIIFKITGILVFLLIIIGLITSYFLFFKEDKVKKLDYVSQIKEELDDYYEYEEIEDLTEILDEIKNKEEILVKVQKETLNKCEEWISLYSKEKIKNKKHFDEVTNKYKKLIMGIYNDVTIFYKNNYVRLLNKKEYDSFMNQISDIYEDKLLYYEALDLYEKKDYNKSYHSFDKIDEENLFYKEALDYKVKIIDNILALINKDIEKLEANSDNFSDEEKLLIYTQIENIIYEYGNVYIDVKLNENNEYVEILNKYKDKVNEYTNLIFNNENNQAS